MRLGVEGENVIGGDGAGAPVRIEGRVLDGERQPIDDALLELWQADGRGEYPTAASVAAGGFWGFGRASTGRGDGRYRFETVKPGPTPAPDALGGGLQAPHLALIVQARGMLRPCFTRVYFGDEAAANARDPILALTPSGRRATLVAERIDAGDAVPTYRFDVRFQGEDETVFFGV
ncbi:MAG: protocatechuate 3,4-dioxygenase subunit alpha [Acidimicrobiales bacterium]